MPGPSDEALQTRWKTEDGEARRARLIAHLPGDWRAHATPWSDDADVRPDLRGIDLQKARLAGVDLSDTRLDAAIFDGAAHEHEVRAARAGPDPLAIAK